MDGQSDLAFIDNGSLQYEPTVFSHYNRVLRSHADRTAIVVAHQSSNHLHELTSCPPRSSEIIVEAEAPSCLSWNFRQLHNAAVQIVFGLENRGVKPGATVVCFVPNGIEWAILFWASFVGKYTLCCVDVGALQPSRSEELQSHLQRLKPGVVFVPDGVGAKAIDVALNLQKLATKCKVILQQDSITSDHDKLGWCHLISLPQATIKPLDIERIEQAALIEDHDRVASILFTSGTSIGKPKGCPHTVRELLHYMTQHWDSGEVNPPRRMIQSANFRVVAVGLALGTWSSGGTIILPSAVWDPQASLAALQDREFAVSMAYLSPAHLHALVTQPNFATAADQILTLKTILLGADLITKDIYLKACTAFPRTHIIGGFGMTEGAGMTAWPVSYVTGAQDLPFKGQMLPLGKASLGTRFRIASEDVTVVDRRRKQETLKKGQVGELHVWNEGVIRQYLDGVNESDFYTDDNGHRWFNTGDVGLMDDDGWLYALGRKKDIIKRAGVPITPAAIESSLNSYLQSQASVFGINDPVLGQVPYAVVESLEGKSKADIERYILESFGPDYKLGGVSALSELGLEQFPLTTTGKILKRELMERVIARSLP